MLPLLVMYNNIVYRSKSNISSLSFNDTLKSLHHFNCGFGYHSFINTMYNLLLIMCYDKPILLAYLKFKTNHARSQIV